jgi:hypothetical protein
MEGGMRIRVDTIVIAIALVFGVPYFIYSFMSMKREHVPGREHVPAQRDFVNSGPQNLKTEPQQYRDNLQQYGDNFQPKKRPPDYPMIEVLVKQLDKVSAKPSVAECRNIAPALNQYYILTGSDRTGMETYNKVSLSCLGK